MLVPSLASGAAAELDELRAKCRDALTTVAAVAADITFVVGLDDGPRAMSFAPWGVEEPLDVPEPLPLALLVGAWWTAGTQRSFVAVADDLNAADCADVGAELAASAARVSLLVMGDGSARHSEKGPGYLDERAAGFDDGVADALRRADAQALLALDVTLARELQVAGRAPWQVLAGAAADRQWSVTTATSTPYGVAYHVASWT
jgi:hypothetical protein